MTHDADLTTTALRDLDPAAATDLTATERIRAEATFARIVATPPEALGERTPSRRRSRRRRLLVPVGLAGAAALAIPAGLIGGGSAFGSWTPEPRPLPAAAAQDAAAACRALLGVPDGGGAVEIAERRGGWAFVLFTGPAEEGSCLMPEDVVDADDPAAHRGDGFFGSYTTDPPPLSDGPPAGGIEEDTSMTGSIPSGSPWPFSRDDWFSWVEGFVGRDVVAVTVHPPVGPDVEASVVDGRYAAWWPAGKAIGDNPGLGGAFSYTLTLADGTTRDVAG